MNQKADDLERLSSNFLFDCQRSQKQRKHVWLLFMQKKLTLYKTNKNFFSNKLCLLSKHIEIISLVSNPFEKHNRCFKYVSLQNQISTYVILMFHIEDIVLQRIFKITNLIYQCFMTIKNGSQIFSYHHFSDWNLKCGVCVSRRLLCITLKTSLILHLSRSYS